MVFPARGCRTCVQRRIKCDSLQPICSKCQKSNRECVWNPNDYAGFHFKSENAFAQGKARRPRGSQANKPISLDVTKQSPQLAITVPVAEHALQYWASSYLSRAEDLIEAAHEWQAHVIPYWTTAKPGSCLHLAVSTLSQATFSRAHNIPHALAKADKSYLQCLARTQQAVCGQANETMDALLLTTIMMGYFENIRYSVDASKTAVRQDDAVGSRFTNVFCHYEGAVGLMKVRHERADKSNLTLDRVVRRQIVRASILRGQTVPDWLQHGEQFGETGPALQIDSFMVRTAAFRSRALAFFSKDTSALPTSVPDLEHLAHTGKELENDLVDWMHSVPEEWEAGRSATLDNTPEGSGDLMTYHEASNSYASHGHASIWLRQRALRLIINSIFIKFVAMRMQSSTDHEHLIWKRNRMRGNLESISAEMCRDVPFFFNAGKQDVNGESVIPPKLAGLLAWPLAVAVSTENVPEPQRQWLQQRLRTVAKSLGDSVLGAVADRGEFKF